MLNPKDTIESVIPRGIYCYGYADGKYNVCPFWSKSAHMGYQENGYCSFLSRGDWDEGGMGLLWDQIKECGVNE